jgi:ABC-2 type transport system ATP-binding protein
MIESIIETVGLGHRYGRIWALRECHLQLPANHVIGLVGPNGAGKTTLLHILAGLLRPTTGRATVLGGQPGQLLTRSRVSFVAQDKPLYCGFTVAETLGMGSWLNPTFRIEPAAQRLEALGIPLRRRVSQLSGGQQAQVALALALGKQPDLLLLDEPVSSLDPLAQREFLGTLMADVAEAGLSVLFSSHALADLERTCDYIVLLSASRIQLCGGVDDLRADHLMLSGPRSHVAAIADSHTVIHADYGERQVSLLVHARRPIHDPLFTVRSATLEEVVLGYMSKPEETALPPVRLVSDRTDARP